MSPRFLNSILFFAILINISFLHTNASGASSKRGFNDPEMHDKSIPTKEWIGRIDLVKKALAKIKKKLDNPNSEIYQKFSDCISDAMKNLFEPKINGWKDIPQDFKEIKVTLSKEGYPSDKDKRRTQAAVVRKVGLHEKVNETTYHGNMHGEIRIYPDAFEPDKINCLEPFLFHEILHLACFTKQEEKTMLEKWLGEKIAYACTY